jgi:hypothetical protein
VVFQVAEICDGKDNNCDGLTDNVTYNPPTCSTTPQGCQGSFKVSGTYKCQGGNTICSVTVNQDYCNSCGSQACGECGASPCPGMTKCSPGYVCKPAPPQECNIQGPFSVDQCWPIDKFHCNGCGPNVICWTPAQVLSGTCPPP